MDNFALTYLLLVFGGSLGVYQIAAAGGGFKGLWFFKTALPTYLCGFLILGGTSVWFFSQTNLNMRHAEIEGSQQLGFFLLGCFLSLVATFLISSITNFRGVRSNDSEVIGKGIEDLKTRTVIQAFAYRLRNRGANK